MTLAPEVMVPGEDWAEFRANRECVCGICCGASEGVCGYRPHTLDEKCWCIGKSSHKDCRLQRDWKLTDKELEGAGLPRREGESANALD